MTNSQHTWTDEDNLVAYHLYRFGNDSFPFSKFELAETLGMSLSSLNYKIANFKAIDGKGGFDGYSRQAVKIYKKYHSVPDAEITEAALRAVAQALEVKMSVIQDELAKRRQ